MAREELKLLALMRRLEEREWIPAGLVVLFCHRSGVEFLPAPADPLFPTLGNMVCGCPLLQAELSISAHSFCLELAAAHVASERWKYEMLVIATAGVSLFPWQTPQGLVWGMKTVVHSFSREYSSQATSSCRTKIAGRSIEQHPALQASNLLLFSK